MVEKADREPTIAEIAVALHETRQSAARPSQFSVVDGNQAGDTWSSVVATGVSTGAGLPPRHAAEAQNEVGSTDIGDLRDDETERLLSENARLNERVMFLLKIIEGLQARDTRIAAERAAIETDRGAIFRGLGTAIEAELRPFLVVVLRLLEKQRTEPNRSAEARFPARPVEQGTHRPPPQAARAQAHVALPVGSLT